MYKISKGKRASAQKWRIYNASQISLRNSMSIKSQGIETPDQETQQKDLSKSTSQTSFKDSMEIRDQRRESLSPKGQQRDLSEVISKNIQLASDGIILLEINKLQALEDKIEELKPSTLHHVLLLETLKFTEITNNISDLEGFEGDLLEILKKWVDAECAGLILQWFKEIICIDELDKRKKHLADTYFKQLMACYFFPSLRTWSPTEKETEKAEELTSCEINPEGFFLKLQDNISKIAGEFIHSKKKELEVTIKDSLCHIMFEYYEKEMETLRGFRRKYKHQDNVEKQDDKNNSRDRKMYSPWSFVEQCKEQSTQNAAELEY